MSTPRLLIAKHIADPVHGTVGLTEVETRVIDTRVFQRLRNVKHLGLAYLVFPAADFSRFAHSLGVCHVTGRLLEALALAGANLSEKSLQEYRLAGLLHDIGHYPLSHALEKPVIEYLKDRSAEGLLEPIEAEAPNAKPNASSLEELDHEEVGRIILEEDRELRAAIGDAGIDPDEVARIFTRDRRQLAGVEEGKIDPLVNLVSSDLDADRIDFLLRTSRSTGLPYGSVDLDYILSQITIDPAGRVCLHERAMRTVDHLLLARFFDSQQVAFHKTVAVLEELAKDIVAQLLRLGIVEIDEEWIRNAIRTKSWDSFDDPWLMRTLAETASSGRDDVSAVLKLKIDALLNRRPPKLVAFEERFREVNSPDAERNFNRLVREYRGIAEEAAARFGLDAGLFYVWTKRDFRLSKMSGSIPADALEQEGGSEEDRWVQAVRILPRVSENPSSRAIMRMPNSLMSILSNYVLDAVRLYVLEPPGREGIAKEVRTWLQERLS